MGEEVKLKALIDSIAQTAAGQWIVNAHDPELVVTEAASALGTLVRERDEAREESYQLAAAEIIRDRRAAASGLATGSLDAERQPEPRAEPSPRPQVVQPTGADVEGLVERLSRWIVSLRDQKTATCLADHEERCELAHDIETLSRLLQERTRERDEARAKVDHVLDRVARAYGLLWASVADGHTRSGQNVQSARRVLMNLLSRESQRGGIAMLAEDEKLSEEDMRHV